MIMIGFLYIVAFYTVVTGICSGNFWMVATGVLFGFAVFNGTEEL
jgi:hypothetical protein